jgi:hypothetical protein
MSHGGWYPRHRAVLELLDAGEIGLPELAIDDFLYMKADYRTGLAIASAEKIRVLCSTGSDLRAIQRSLARLEEVGRIKRFQLRGKRGNYPVLCCHYFVREASGNWKMVNANRTIDWRDIQYDDVGDLSSLSSDIVMRRGTASSPADDGSDTRPGSELTPSKEEEQDSENKSEGKKLTRLSEITRFTSLTAITDSCSLKTEDAFGYLGILRSQIPGFYFNEGEFADLLLQEFREYKEDAHDDGECFCEPHHLLNVVLRRCKELRIRYPKGALAALKTLQRRHREIENRESAIKRAEWDARQQREVTEDENARDETEE